MYLVLLLCTKGAANSFLVRFDVRLNSRQQSDEQAAWRAMGENYFNSSMRKLNGMAMRLNQDPDKYLTEVFQQRDELEHIGESCIRRASWILFCRA